MTSDEVSPSIFQAGKKENIALPAPHGPLSSKVPPGTSKLQNPPPGGSTGDASASRSNRGNYMKVSDAQDLLLQSEQHSLEQQLR